MEEFKITIRPTNIYEVLVDGKPIGEFKMDSEWEGMVKLSNETKAQILAMRHHEDLGITNVLDKIFNNDEQSKEMTVLRMSPSLYEHFNIGKDKT